MKKKVKYIGNYLTFLVAFAYLLLILLPITFAVFILISQLNTATVFIAFMCVLLVIILIALGKKVSIISQLYTWYLIDKDGVIIKSLFSKKHKIHYSKCNDLGIVYYTHGILNSHIGSKQLFIYLSYDMIPTRYKNAANYLIPTNTTVKISYNKSTFNYLTSVLPKKQKGILMNNSVNFLNDLSLE